MSEASEARVAEYLGELRDDDLRADDRLTRSVVHRARWQQAVRTPVAAVGILTAALGEGMALVLGLRRHDS